ncbi:MAG: hypothetical protein ACREAA_07340 [Candidatus Polarisedimenticolia bacterium]
MARFRRNVVAALLVLAFVGLTEVRGAVTQPGPVDHSGEINGAPFRVVVPAAWNGTLLVFQRRYTDKADHPGEIEDRTPNISSSGALRDALLAGGYALAGTARSGWSVEEGLQDNVALVSYFRENLAKPVNTILWGDCLGGLIVQETAERDGGAFDGYLALCSIGAGATQLADHFLVLRLAYDITFGMPGSWGTPGDVRDDLDFETEVGPILFAQLSDPAHFGRFEFIRLVSGIPGSGITPPPGLFPGRLFDHVFVGATEGTAEGERRAGGPVAQNIDHSYSLTEAEKAYLTSLGVDADPLLEAMNARRNIAAPQGPRNYAKHFADFSGLIKRPVLTVHAAIDELYPVAHESAYRKKITAARRDNLLVQVYTTGVGFCGVSLAQRLAAIQAIDAWTRTGIRPLPSAFPAALGFNPGFEPPAWPQSDGGPE